MTRFSWLTVLLALGVPAAAARKAALPTAQAALASALSPSIAYTARGRVQSFPKTGKPRAQAWTVTEAPGGRTRQEWASSAKKPASLLYADDGKTQGLAYPRRGLSWSGASAHDPAADAAALQDVYDLAVATGPRVAGRSTWRLEFRDKARGQLRRTWFVDRKTGVALRRESHRADGTLARRERFSRFEAAARADEPFSLSASTAALPWSEPGAPSWRPRGYLPLERSAAGGVLLRGYGNGTESFTFMRGGALPAAKAVMSSREHLAVRIGAAAGRVAILGDGVALAWPCGAEACLLVGDLLEDELLRAARSVGASR